MALISHNELLQLIRDGVITNVDNDQVNGTSIDVTLGAEILVEKVPQGGIVTQPRNWIVDLRARFPLRTRPVTLDPDEGYLLKAGEFILASTQQMFYLPMNVSAEYKLKSSMARIGIEHLNAGWCDPGWNGSVLTLELRNMTRYHDIRIRPGDRIGQMIFWRSENVPYDKSYATRGRYNNDMSVQDIKA